MLNVILIEYETKVKTGKKEMRVKSSFKMLDNGNVEISITDDKGTQSTQLEFGKLFLIQTMIQVRWIVKE